MFYLEVPGLQCTATLVSGQPCKRTARSGLALCGFHLTRDQRRQADSFYMDVLTEDERRQLAVAAQLDGIDTEIAVLRVLIRRVVTKGEVEKARRGIDTLCRILRTRHDLDERSTGQLASSLERVLDDLGRGLEAAR
jgi:hypothetical protein